MTKHAEKRVSMALATIVIAVWCSFRRANRGSTSQVR
jgi:hypothetical protein